MAKCKQCKANIPDGSEYCKDCLDKGNATNESYLDSLLNSVKNTAPTTDIYKKKGASNRDTVEQSNFNRDIDKNNSNHVDDENESNNRNNAKIGINKVKDFYSQNDDIYKFDLEDIEDFDQFDINDDLSDLKDDLLISDEELFGDNLSMLFTNEGKRKSPRTDKTENEKLNNKESISPIVREETEEEETDKDLHNKALQDNSEILEKKVIHEEKGILDEQDEEAQLMENMNSNSDESFADISNMNGSANEDEVNEFKASIDTNNDSNISTNEIETFQEDDNFDTDLDFLLNSLDSIQDDNGEISENQTKEEITTEEKSVSIDSNSLREEHLIEESLENFHQLEEDDDLFSLLNQISSDDPVLEDVKAISDLMSGKPAKPQRAQNMPSDVGEVFSDALKVVSNLNDPNINEAELLDKIPNKKSKKAKRNIDKKKSNRKQNAEAQEEKPKISLFKRLFGNVEDNDVAKKSKASERSIDENSGENKKTKNGKPPKGKKGKTAEGINEAQTGEKKGKEKGKEKSEGDEAESNKGNKKEKKVKKDKKKNKEIIQVIDEIDEDEGRINRLGAAIVFVFFGLLTLLIIVGTNAVSYTLRIENATEYFGNQKYTQAYNEVYGMEIKDADIEIYDKIMTVMYVNKQLNSYNSYYALEQYPQALDSLLKGLKRYDKYIELATILEISTDMDYVRGQILAELKSKFSLSEKSAIKINNIDNMKKYSLKVYDIALKHE